MDHGAIDEQVARLHPEIKSVADKFVLLKIGNMRGVDLQFFDFDYDLSWAVLMFDSAGEVLGRFGGRDAETPGKYHSLRGLRYSLEQAWERFDRKPSTKQTKPAAAPKHVEDYPTAQRFAPKACFHCHHVREFQREQRIKAGTWSMDDFWVYPEPGSIGLTMEQDHGNKVQAVVVDSPAARAGIESGDVLKTLHGRPVASVADVQYALHHAPSAGTIRIGWQRAGKEMHGDVVLAKGWRQGDISWRWSLKTFGPPPQVLGEDLSAADKQRFAIPATRLAIRQGGFVPQAAQQAGIRIGDVILGVDGRQLDMNARQFEAFMRLNYKVGDLVNFDVQRGQERLKIAVKLPE